MKRRGLNLAVDHPFRGRGINGCSPSKPEPVKTVAIADGDFDPVNWGKAYPLEYESWLKTQEPDRTGKANTKRGMTPTRLSMTS